MVGKRFWPLLVFTVILSFALAMTSFAGPPPGAAPSRDAASQAPPPGAPPVAPPPAATAAAAPNVGLGGGIGTGGLSGNGGLSPTFPWQWYGIKDGSTYAGRVVLPDLTDWGITLMGTWVKQDFTGFQASWPVYPALPPAFFQNVPQPGERVDTTLNLNTWSLDAEVDLSRGVPGPFGFGPRVQWLIFSSNAKVTNNTRRGVDYSESQSWSMLGVGFFVNLDLGRVTGAYGSMAAEYSPILGTALTAGWGSDSRYRQWETTLRFALPVSLALLGNDYLSRVTFSGMLGYLFMAIDGTDEKFSGVPVRTGAFDLTIDRNSFVIDAYLIALGVAF